MKLYEISGEYLELEKMMDEDEPDIQAVKDTLESLAGEFDDKADSIACMIKDYRKDEADLKAEADALTARAKRKKAKADWLTGYLFGQMRAIGRREIETSRNLLKIKATPPAVKLEDETAFITWAGMNHPEYLRQKPSEVDREAVKDALKAGEKIPGASLESGEKLYFK